MYLKNKIFNKCNIAINLKAAFKLFLDQKPKIINQNNIKFLFHKFDESLLKFVSNPPQKYNNDPLLPPYHPLLYVGNLFKNNIIINKFMHLPGHVVCSSEDINSKQGEKLNFNDISLMSYLLKEFNFKGVSYYNSGINSGCTQLHKHIQFAPIDETPLLDLMYNNYNFQFKYFIEPIKDFNENSIFNSYNNLILKINPKIDYNFLINSKAIYLIPRKSAQHSTGIVINSLGLCGHLAIWNWSNPLIENNPLNIFNDLCILNK